MPQFNDVTAQMADEVVGSIVIGSLLNGRHPLELVDAMRIDGILDPEFVEAAWAEYQRRDPEGSALVTPDEVAEAIYSKLRDTVTEGL